MSSGILGLPVCPRARQSRADLPDENSVAYEPDAVRSYYGDQATSARSDANTALAAVESQVNALEEALAADLGSSPAVTPTAARTAHDRSPSQLAALNRRRSNALATAKDYEIKATALYAKAKKAAEAIGAS
jgi:hypothetical protein